jgi:hypothetical protein
VARPPQSGRNLICLYCPMSIKSPIHSMSRTDCEEQCLHPANVNIGAAAGPAALADPTTVTSGPALTPDMGIRSPMKKPR